MSVTARRVRQESQLHAAQHAAGGPRSGTTPCIPGRGGLYSACGTPRDDVRPGCDDEHMSVPHSRARGRCPHPWIASLPRRASGSTRPSPRPRRHRSAPGRARRGDHVLVVAPTGSGKTLAAFLSCIDRLLHAAPPAPDGRKLGTRVLYVSPLKALAVDVERNLRSPLVGITQAARPTRRGVPRGHRRRPLGRHPAAGTSRLISHPPDILITTPESLFLMLTSAARETLRDVDTVIVDEIHAVAGTKRARTWPSRSNASTRCSTAGAPHRTQRDGAAPRRGRPFPRRLRAGARRGA